MKDKNTNPTRCRHCGSTRIVSNGHMYRFRARKKYKQARFMCKNCGRTTMGRCSSIEGK